MTLQEIGAGVFLLSEIAQIALLGVLIGRRAYRAFPVFTLYIAFNILSDVIDGAMAAANHSGSTAISVYHALLPVQYLLEVGVLFEIARNVLRPVQTSLPKNSLKIFAALLVAALAGGILLAYQTELTRAATTARYIVRLDLAFGVLRMATFIATAAFAQMLGIGWKSRVLQLATGLSFYSAVSLMIGLAESHFGKSDPLDVISAAAYTGTLSFWIWAFSTKEAARKEFTPRMQELLVSLSGSADRTRAALQRSQLK